MARIRSIKPDFWTDEKVVELSAFARLLFIGLWNFADDKGRMQFSPKKIKMQIFPADNLDIFELFVEIRGKNMIEVYEIDSIEYLQICNFDKHQKIDKRTASKFPDIKGIFENSAELPREVGDFRIGREKEGKGKGREKEGINTIVAEATSPSSKTEDGIPDCPQEEIKSLYKQILPSLTQPRVWDAARATALRARWVWVLSAKKPNGDRYATSRDEGLDFFKRFFEYVSKSDFLMGNNGKWQADLVWLCKAEKFAKVIEGAYENKAAA